MGNPEKRRETMVKKLVSELGIPEALAEVLYLDGMRKQASKGGSVKRPRPFELDKELAKRAGKLGGKSHAK